MLKFHVFNISILPLFVSLVFSWMNQRPDEGAPEEGLVRFVHKRSLLAKRTKPFTTKVFSPFQKFKNTELITVGTLPNIHT